MGVFEYNGNKNSILNHVNYPIFCFFYRISFGQRLGLEPSMGVGAAIATCMFIIIGAAVALYFKYFGKDLES